MGIDVTVSIGDRRLTADLGSPVSIAIPLDFHGPQPGAFHLPPATAGAVVAGTFVGDTRQGGSVNCETVTFCPHGNGTHTECVGHVLDDRVAVSDVLRGGLFSAALVTVGTVSLAASGDSYAAPSSPGDRVVSREALASAVARVPDADRVDALVVRVEEAARLGPITHFSGACPAYFTDQAMALLAAGRWTHLLTELPSADRDDDAGMLANHRRWWGLAADQRTLGSADPSPRTITELAWVPRDVPNGLWLLAIEVPAFVLDAAPSRPLLYPLVARP